MITDSEENIHSLCVFGHRDMTFTKQDEIDIYNLFEDFIVNKKVGIFYFGGFGTFDSVCHSITTKLKEKYLFIKRVYVCEDYKFISRPHKRPKWLKDEDYEAFEYFDMRYTGFYQRIYFRNCEIIDHSDICVFCVDETAEYSGAKKALEYARRKKKDFVNMHINTKEQAWIILK